MPIMYGNVAWPPPECAMPEKWYREWAAWYAGVPDELVRVYGGTAAGTITGQRFFGTQTGTGTPHAAQYSGGLRGAIARMWWGRPPSGAQYTTKLHVPCASDISALSADLLFGEPPAFSVDVDDKPKPADTRTPQPASVGGPNDGAPPQRAALLAPAPDPTQERLEEILDYGGAYSVMLEAAELSSAFGGVFLKACVDTEISDVPLLEAVRPDVAIPQWRYGKLSAVTFWREIAKDDKGKVWRHLELHEPGVIYHALYLGDDDKLGVPMPLESMPECKHFATLVDANGAIATGVKTADGRPKLDVQYVPNVRPNRVMLGSPLGRSDYSGAEGLMDAMDETWSSWMRDVRNGKGRLIVPDAYLQSGGRGKGAYFDAEQEIFQALNMLPGADAGSMLTNVQFAIRVAEHEQTTAALWRGIMRSAGLSSDAFGEESGGPAMTAKEAGQRKGRTDNTRIRKVNYWRPALQWMSDVLIQLDILTYKTAGVKPQPIDVEWPDSATIDPESQARTLQLLDAAKAISTPQKVEMLHPDWSDAQIDAEVELIDGPKMEDPGMMGLGGMLKPGGPPSPMSGQPPPAMVPMSNAGGSYAGQP